LFSIYCAIELFHSEVSAMWADRSQSGCSGRPNLNMRSLWGLLCLRWCHPWLKLNPIRRYVSDKSYDKMSSWHGIRSRCCVAYVYTFNSCGLAVQYVVHNKLRKCHECK